jgi:protein SCO1/2
MSLLRAIHTRLSLQGILAGVFSTLFLVLLVKTCLDNSPTLANVFATAATNDFVLTDDDGQPVTEYNLLGKPSALFFGYTRCPSICPTTLFELSNWLKALKSDADKLNGVFISVDSARDTPKTMKAYLSSFDPHIRGFSGTEQQIQEITSEYRVYFKRIELDHGDYGYDHSALIHLTHKDGRPVGVISPDDSDSTALKKLSDLIKGG